MHASHRKPLTALDGLQKEAGLLSRAAGALLSGIPAPQAPSSPSYTHPGPALLVSSLPRPSCFPNPTLPTAGPGSMLPPREHVGSFETLVGWEQALTCPLVSCLPPLCSGGLLWEPPQGSVAAPPAHPLHATTIALGPATGLKVARVPRQTWNQGRRFQPLGIMYSSFVLNVNLFETKLEIR